MQVRSFGPTDAEVGPVLRGGGVSEWVVAERRRRGWDGLRRRQLGEGERDRTSVSSHCSIVGEM